MDEDYNLTEVVETKNIVKTAVGAEAETLKELNNDANQRRIKIYGKTRFCGNVMEIF